MNFQIFRVKISEFCYLQSLTISGHKEDVNNQELESKNLFLIQKHVISNILQCLKENYRVNNKAYSYKLTPQCFPQSSSDNQLIWYILLSI